MAMWSYGRLVVITMVIMSFCRDFATGQDGTTEIEDHDEGQGDNNCHLTSQTFYGYIVRVWNSDWRNTSAHGSILAYRAILTTCSPFVTVNDATKAVVIRPLQHFTVYGQKERNIVDPEWNLDGGSICFQARKVVEIRPHPRCTPVNDLDSYYNFAVIVMEKPFLVFRQFTYPTLNFPSVLQDMVYWVSLVNIRRDPGCEIPLLYYHAQVKPVLSHHMRVKSLRYFVECIPRICEFPPYVFTPGAFRYPGHFPSAFHGTPAQQRAIREQTRKMCEESLRRLQNFTMLCTYFYQFPQIKIGHPYMDVRSHLWTGGAPLVCNGTAIGHTAIAIDRHEMAEFTQDFYVINTYIRVWSWMKALRKEFGQNWLEDHLIEKDMKDRGAKAREGGPIPPVPADQVRSLSDDGNDDVMNRSTMNRQSLIMTFGSILAAITASMGCFGHS
uniref:Uncharacterized protein n=1 Tax=Lygus hesperus TaxID=30085 RepID=A0A0A9XF20_LYGHE